MHFLLFQKSYLPTNPYDTQEGKGVEARAKWRALNSAGKNEQAIFSCPE